MMNKRVKSSLILSMVLGLAALTRSAAAAVILTIDNVYVPAPSVAIVGVYASSNSGDVISGFNLPLDINDDGYTAGILPAGFTLDANDLRRPIYTNTGLDMPQPQITLINVDAIATGSGANVQLSSTPTLLFDLAVDVAATVPVGTRVPLEIEVPNAPFQTLFDVAGPGSPVTSAPTNGSPVYGSITVVGVPEPTNIALSALPAICLSTPSIAKGAHSIGPLIPLPLFDLIFDKNDLKRKTNMLNRKAISRVFALNTLAVSAFVLTATLPRGPF